jgi:hypothetical protein
MLLGFGAAAPLLEAKSKSGQHVTLLCRPWWNAMLQPPEATPANIANSI